MSFSALDLISAHSWQRSVFTTYALSLSFFEAVILDALVRTGGSKTLILADVAGIRAALSEQGARRAGRDYEVEPIVARAGVFHPKISLLSGGDECHLLVGSGNLTFGGWGGNLETVEHLHPSFAPDAIGDAADFFEYLSFTEQVQHGASTECIAIADELRAAIKGRPQKGDIRLFHSLDGAIYEKMAQVVQDLGGASRIVAVSPFWDSGQGIDTFCEAIGIDHVFAHSHPHGSVEGSAGTNWPGHTTCSIKPVQLGSIKDDGRRLHAKMFEVMCRRGRILLSGSANATTAGLGSGRNVEASVVRIQRETTVGWNFEPTDPPELTVAPEDNLEPDDPTIGVLRAVLTGDQLQGRVLTPQMQGTSIVSQVTTEGAQRLGESTLSADGTFTIDTPGLEIHSWMGGRLVIRVESSDRRIAEGFVSVAAYAEIVRRVGSLGPRLFAIIAGTETPADVAAIMAWYHEDPKRLASAPPSTIGGGSGQNGELPDNGSTIRVSELNSTHAVSPVLHGERETNAGVSWQRFMAHVFASFSERRGALGKTGAGRTGDDDDDDAENPQAGVPDLAVAKSLETFGRLLALLLSAKNAEGHALHAFDLAQYLCERLQPDEGRVRHWLKGIVEALIRFPPSPERRADVAAAIITLLGESSEPDGPREARSKLLQLGFDLAGLPPAEERAYGFQLALSQKASFEELWARVNSVRTYEEHACAYVNAWAGEPSSDYGELASAAPQEWPMMQGAVKGAQDRNKILVLKERVHSCPKCNIGLPASEIQKLRRVSIATASNCCGRVLIFPGAN